MQLIPGTEVMSAIAHLVLGPASASSQLGDIRLRGHQRTGAERLTQLLKTHGGALLADDVGLGKTFTALAVARAFERPLVLAPAGIRHAWLDASRRAGVGVEFASFEALAGEAVSPKCHDLVIIDEAHHLRNAATKRFLAAKAACATARVLLLSAVPVQNRTADLRVVLSLFLGERAHAISLVELSGFVVRRPEPDVADVDDRPLQDPPLWLQPDGDVDCLEAIIALPSPLTAADAGDGGVLLRYTLVRQWASSRAALIAALKRRLAWALALEDTLSRGGRATRAELSAWLFADGVQQLSLPLVPAGAAARDDSAWLSDVRRLRDALRALMSSVSEWPDPDESRADRLRELVTRQPDRRIIAFSEYTATVEALFRKLAPTTRVAALTHTGGRLAHGRLSRAELLARFRPGGRDVGGDRERIDLLLTTDVLSEGVDLHDASIVVHLDMPWNPARLAQRVGRVRRIGSPERSVSVYAMAPPAPAERLLELERRLRAKLHDAAQVAPLAAPLPGVGDALPDAAGCGERLATILAAWRRSSPPSYDWPVAGAVRAAEDGALVCLRRSGSVELLACGATISTDPAEVARLAESAQPRLLAAEAADVRGVMTAIREWLKARDTTDVIDLPSRRLAKSRADLLRRTDTIARRAPLHARPTLSPLLLAARRVATVPLSAGAEDVLDALARSPLDDSAWLQAIGQFASIHNRVPKDEAPEVLAVLLMKR